MAKGMSMEEFRQALSSDAREENEKLKAQKAELKPLPNLEKLIKKHSYFKSLNSDNATSLMNKVKGMGLLRTMIVFGFVYR